MHDNSPLTFEKVTSTIKDKIMQTIFQQESTKENSEEDLVKEVSSTSYNSKL